MSKIKASIRDPLPRNEDALLNEDGRWAALQRILASPGFRRAVQLRNILVYITRSAILRPEEPVREYEIACEVLGRRSDFDPDDDNIVRAQMTHLRRKLDAYYKEEGLDDPLRLSIPKGSYLPVFAETVKLPASERPQPLGFPSGSAPNGNIPPAATGSNASIRRYRRLILSLSIACLALVATIGVLVREMLVKNAARAMATAEGNAFVQLIAHLSGPVKIVLPDTSLVILRAKFDPTLTLQEYARPDYLQQQIDAVKDPDFHYLLTLIRKMRTTSYDEVAVGMDIQSVLNISSISSRFAFAHETTIRDVSEGNSVLIGSYRSNPLAALFKDQLNYRFEEDPATKDCYFSNQHPANGEPARYFAYTQDRSQWLSGKKDMGSYVDIALVPNLTHSGHVLLLNGSDGEAIVAALRFLMHGKLPPSIDSVLRKKDPGYFEFFFHGSHADSQDEVKFELLSVRSEQGK